MSLTKADFGKNFKWGVSTAAYQIEGGYNMHGKGQSIWDEFVNKKGRIFKNHHGKIACDFYTRYAKDISLMAGLNIPNYRFSIAWSRIFPNGAGVVNRDGVDFCVKHFGDRIKHWIVLNEPMVFTGAGYFLGVHAPGKKGLNNFLAAVHHASMCQAEGGRLIKSLRPLSKVGTTFSCSHIEPYRNIEKDLIAVKKVDALLNRLFIEPLLGKSYPVNDLKILQRIEKFIMPGDEAKLAFDMDFIGVQNYTRELVSHTTFMPFIKAKIIKGNKRKVETTLMNWEVYPESVYHCLKKFDNYKSIKELIITESGAAFFDIMEDGVIN
ncbi:MAG: family 1 glycosylhydrolase, partial [Chitinophagaceae bacterium]|nr:family 1 glycosylhydrolase [Chitinophagaceae bacterium]